MHKSYLFLMTSSTTASELRQRPHYVTHDARRGELEDDHVSSNRLISRRLATIQVLYGPITFVERSQFARCPKIWTSFQALTDSSVSSSREYMNVSWNFHCPHITHYAIPALVPCPLRNILFYHMEAGMRARMSKFPRLR